MAPLKLSLFSVLSAACAPFPLFIVMLKTKCFIVIGCHSADDQVLLKVWFIRICMDLSGKVRGSEWDMSRGWGPSGVRKASTPIAPDEDKWTGPIWSPCGRLSSIGKGGSGMASWMMDVEPNWWPAGLEMGSKGLSTDRVAWVSIYPEHGSEIKWSARGRCEGIGTHLQFATLAKSERYVSPYNQRETTHFPFNQMKSVQQ